MANEDFYKALGVSRTATDDEIKKAYKKLARDLHPDKNPGKKEIETRFKAVNRAYETLHDSKKRKLYDEFGEEGLREGFDAEKARAYRSWQERAGAGGNGGFGGGGGGTVNLEDLFGGAVPGGQVDFGDLFGRTARRRGPQRGHDLEQAIEIDFDAAVRGTTLELRTPGGSDVVTVRIPAGAAQGSRVRIAGQGAASPNGGPRGDLILEIHVRPHAFFTRDGDDLDVEVPITVSEAILGAKVKVPTFDGPVALKVPPMTQSGTKLRLRGKGVARKGRPAGDLYVRFMIEVPKKSTPKLLEIAAELAVLEAADAEAGGDLRAKLNV